MTNLTIEEIEDMKIDYKLLFPKICHLLIKMNEETEQKCSLGHLFKS
jgi:hypothetical protein